MFTIASFFAGMVFGVPWWVISVAMICDTVLLVNGIERL